MNKAKKKAANRRLKRLLTRYKKAQDLYILPRYQRHTTYTARQSEILF